MMSIPLSSLFSISQIKSEPAILVAHKITSSRILALCEAVHILMFARYKYPEPQFFSVFIDAYFVIKRTIESDCKGKLRKWIRWLYVYTVKVKYLSINDATRENANNLIKKMRIILPIMDPKCYIDDEILINDLITHKYARLEHLCNMILENNSIDIAILWKEYSIEVKALSLMTNDFIIPD